MFDIENQQNSALQYLTFKNLDYKQGVEMSDI